MSDHEPTPEERAEHREYHLQELRDLLEGTHETEERMREAVQTMMEIQRKAGKEITDEAELYITLQMLHIAFTAAILAAETVGTEEEGMVPGMVLGMWAGSVMQAHQSANAIREQLEMLFGGMSQN